jgi:hypothetical protein
MSQVRRKVGANKLRVPCHLGNKVVDQVMHDTALDPPGDISVLGHNESPGNKHIKTAFGLVQSTQPAFPRHGSFSRPSPHQPRPPKGGPLGENAQVQQAVLAASGETVVQKQYDLLLVVGIGGVGRIIKDKVVPQDLEVL